VSGLVVSTPTIEGKLHETPSLPPPKKNIVTPRDRRLFSAECSSENWNIVTYSRSN